MPVFGVEQHAAIEVRVVGFDLLMTGLTVVLVTCVVFRFRVVDHVTGTAEVVLHLRNRRIRVQVAELYRALNNFDSRFVRFNFIVVAVVCMNLELDIVHVWFVFPLE
jgi:hypothetical protein